MKNILKRLICLVKGHIYKRKDLIFGDMSRYFFYNDAYEEFYCKRCNKHIKKRRIARD